MKIADALWDAANTHLATPEQAANDDYYPSHSRYTCDCVRRAVNRVEAEEDKVTAFLETLGLPANANRCYDLFNTVEGDCSQGVRYTWLLLAFTIAEAEGL